MKTVVIGSGISGLTAAAALAQAGHKVAVFEQFGQVGGVTASYEQAGFRWDLGQLLVEGFGPGEPAGEVLAALGVTERVKIRRDDRGYVFPDFEIRKPGTYSGPRWRIERLQSLFPDESQGLERYWRDYLRFTSVMTLARRLEKASGPAALYWKARLYLKLLPFLPKKDWSAQRLMDDYFRSDQLKCVFISILADFFTPPSQFPGLGVFALNPETVYDKRMPSRLDSDTEQVFHYSLLGGIGCLSEAMAARIRECGGEIFTDRPVARIQVADGRVAGVVDAAGEFTPADLVIASGGAKETMFKLVGEENLPPAYAQSVREIPLMDSVFMVHLGVDMNPAPYVHGVCTYYYGTYDLEGGIRAARTGYYHQGREGFVVHVPTLHSPEMAPAGQHAITLYTICPDRLKDGAWEEHKEEYADELVACAEKYIPGLREATRVCAIFTPEDFRARTHLDHHAFGGIAPLLGSWKVGHQSPVKGLWFVGQQSESGGGVGAVLTAAYKTALKAMKTSNLSEQ